LGLDPEGVGERLGERSRAGRGEEPFLEGERDGLCPVADAELAEQPLDVE